MYQKVLIMFAPSMRAASISSSGSAVLRYWVIQNTPNAVTRPGTMTAPSEPVQPSCDITMNNGTTPNWVGTAVVAMTKTNSFGGAQSRGWAERGHGS